MDIIGLDKFAGFAPSGWSVVGTSGANAAQTVAKAAVAGLRHYALGFGVVITAAASGAAITIQLKDGTTVIWQTAIPTGAAIGTTKEVLLHNPIELSINTALNLTVSAGGASCVTIGNILGFTR